MAEGFKTNFWTVATPIVLSLVVWAAFHLANARVRLSGSKFSERASALNAALSPGTRPADDASLLALSSVFNPTAGETRTEPSSAAPSGPTSTNQGAASTALATLEVAQAVIVTVEVDFGVKLPSIAMALLEFEHRYQPDDGKGRTFAILDAYGEPTPTGKLHISMHVSTEKPGIGSLIFKRTGETLWRSRIVPSKDSKKGQFTGKNLSIFVDDGAGHLLTIDGSNNPTWIMDAVVKERSALLDSVWPTGVEHELTFIYSACGCPVKVMARREGDRVVRTKELPVMFPDDPAVVELIARLMRW